jgi:hypothetical protein
MPSVPKLEFAGGKWSVRAFRITLTSGQLTVNPVNASFSSHCVTAVAARRTRRPHSSIYWTRSRRRDQPHRGRTVLIAEWMNYEIVVHSAHAGCDLGRVHPSVDDGARLHPQMPPVSALRSAPKSQRDFPSSAPRLRWASSYKSISDCVEKSGCECGWAEVASDRLVLHTV